MARYIDADDLSRRMYHEAFEVDSDMQKWDSGCWIRFKLFEEIMKKQPTADVRENVHGEWIPTGQYSHSYKCSVCGRTLFNITDGVKNVSKNYPFCHCGADMKGETNGLNQKTRCD